MHQAPWTSNEWGAWPRNKRQQQMDDQWAALRAAIGRARTVRRIQFLSAEAHRMRAERLIGPKHIDNLNRFVIERLGVMRARQAAAPNN